MLSLAKRLTRLILHFNAKCLYIHRLSQNYIFMMVQWSWPFSLIFFCRLIVKHKMQSFVSMSMVKTFSWSTKMLSFHFRRISYEADVDRYLQIAYWPRQLNILKKIRSTSLLFNKLPNRILNGMKFSTFHIPLTCKIGIWLLLFVEQKMINIMWFSWQTFILDCHNSFTSIGLGTAGWIKPYTGSSHVIKKIQFKL
jgi:hypothetical protein